KRAAALEEAEEEERPARRPRERAGGGALRFAGALLLGVLLAVGGAAAVWFFAPGLLKQTPESPKGVKGQAGADPANQATPAQRAAEQLDIGKYDDALQMLEGASDPAGLAVRGEAKWQKYLKKQRDAKQGLAEDAPPVTEAISDFEAANEKDRAQEIKNIIQVDNALR